MRVKWTKAALEDVANMVAYIADDNPEVAHKIAVTVRTAAESLSRLPHRGRLGVVPNTRELLVPRLPYVIVYAIQGNTMEVLRVMHQAQQWPPAEVIQEEMRYV